MQEGGAPPHVPKPQRGPPVRKGFFSKDEFRYDPARDVYICPAGETLAPHHDGRLRDLKKIDYSNRAACLVCPLRSPPAIAGSHEAVLDRMAARLKARLCSG